MCSITCEEVSIQNNEEAISKGHIGNLIRHSSEKHQGKAIFLNLLDNGVVMIDSPMVIEHDHLFFDCIK